MGMSQKLEPCRQVQTKTYIDEKRSYVAENGTFYVKIRSINLSVNIVLCSSTFFFGVWRGIGDEDGLGHKCKELTIDFKRIRQSFVPISISDKDLDYVTEVKILGLN